MDVFFSCPTCGHEMVIEEAGIGLVVVCEKCGQNVIVPEPALAANNPPPAPAPKNEQTVAMKWTPPPAPPPVDPKK